MITSGIRTPALTIWAALLAAGALMLAAPAPALAQDRVGETATTDGLLARVLAEASAHDGLGYAYRAGINVVAEDERETLSMRFDPSRPAGERFMLSDADEETSEDIDHVEFGEEDDPNGGLPDYAKLADSLNIEDAVLESETETEAIYSLDRGLEDFLDDEMNRFSAHLESKLVIAKTGPAAPYVRQLRIHAPEPFNPAFIATMRTLDIVLTFAPQGARGDILPTAVDLKLEGSALWIGFDATTDIRYDNYRYVGLPSDAGGQDRSE